MKEKFIPQKYELCSRFSAEELAEMCLALSTAKDKHYTMFAKKHRLKKKYADRLLSRTEAYLQFVKNEAQKRGNFDFLYDNNIFMVRKKNKFVGFRVGEVGQNKSTESSA